MHKHRECISEVYSFALYGESFKSYTPTRRRHLRFYFHYYVQSVRFTLSSSYFANFKLNLSEWIHISFICSLQHRYSLLDLWVNDYVAWIMNLIKMYFKLNNQTDRITLSSNSFFSVLLCDSLFIISWEMQAICNDCTFCYLNLCHLKLFFLLKVSKYLLFMNHVTRFEFIISLLW